MNATTTTNTDPVQLAVFANRVDSICREMQNTLLRSARSSMINRHTRFKKPNTPLTPCMLQGFAASRGPMNIS